MRKEICFKMWELPSEAAIPNFQNWPCVTPNFSPLLEMYNPIKEHVFAAIDNWRWKGIAPSGNWRLSHAQRGQICKLFGDILSLFNLGWPLNFILQALDRRVREVQEMLFESGEEQKKLNLEITVLKSQLRCKEEAVKIYIFHYNGILFWRH